MQQQPDIVANKNGSSFPNDELGGNDDEDGDGGDDEDDLPKSIDGLKSNVDNASKYGEHIPVLS